VYLYERVFVRVYMYERVFVRVYMCVTVSCDVSTGHVEL